MQAAWNTVSLSLLNKYNALAQFLLAGRRGYLYPLSSLTKYFKILNFEENTACKIVHFAINFLT